MFSSRTIASVALLALAWATSTTSVGCAFPRQPNRAYVYPDATAEIDIANADLHERCEIVAGRAKYEGDILAGVIQLQNHFKRQLHLQYKWTWYDADDFVQDAGATGTWQNLFIDSLGEKQVNGRATAPGAVRGVFELRGLGKP